MNKKEKLIVGAIIFVICTTVVLFLFNQNNAELRSRLNVGGYSETLK